MRKTITYKTIKTLCLVFAVCFLAATQGIAQSNSEHYSSPGIEIQEHNPPKKFNIWSIFDWLTDIVDIQKPATTPDATKSSVRVVKDTRANIVTTDMSIREGNDED